MEQFDISAVITPAIARLHAALADVRNELAQPNAIIKGVMFNGDSGAVIEGDAATLLDQAISCFDSSEHSANGSVIRYPGVFEVTDSLLACAQRFNDAKHDFEAAVSGARQSGATSNNLRTAYRLAGSPRIHPLQAWRQIVLLGGNLTSIGFSLCTQGKGIEKISRQTAIDRLNNAGAADIAEGLLVHPESIEVRWCTPVNKHIRANVAWGAGDSSVRQMFHASLPILIKSGSWPKKIPFKQPSQRQPRSDRITGQVINLPFREGAYLLIA